METVDFWTKKLSYHFSSHILHSIFWTNLTNKKMHQQVTCKNALRKTLVVTTGLNH